MFWLLKLYLVQFAVGLFANFLIMEITAKKVSPWILFVGFILLIIGLYGAGRIAVNVTVLDKYPTTGIYKLWDSGYPYDGKGMYTQREQDCLYPMTYSNPDGTLRPGTKEEIERDTAQQKICVDGVTETRNNAKVNDISQALFYLFLGAGILVSRKLFA